MLMTNTWSRLKLKNQNFIIKREKIHSSQQSTGSTAHNERFIDESNGSVIQDSRYPYGVFLPFLLFQYSSIYCCFSCTDICASKLSAHLEAKWHLSLWHFTYGRRKGPVIDIELHSSRKHICKQEFKLIQNTSKKTTNDMHCVRLAFPLPFEVYLRFYLNLCTVTIGYDWKMSQ